MRVVARAEDGVVEAIDLPGAPFVLGVQWHPERTEDPDLGLGVFKAIVQAARNRMETRDPTGAPTR
jgi:putative glutamine amidotransferase